MSHKFTNGKVDPSRLTCADCLTGHHKKCVNKTLAKVNRLPACVCKPCEKEASK